MNRFLACTISLLALHCRSEADRHTASVPSTTVTASASPTQSLSPATPGTHLPPTTALAHLPEGCLAAVRMDARVVLHNPRLGEPLLASLEPGSQTATPQQASFARMLAELDLKPSRDLHGLWGCFAPRAGANRFVIAVTGKLPSGLIDAFGRHAPEPEKLRPRQFGARTGFERDGRFLAQADDGALVFGDDAELVSAALTPRPDPYRLPMEGDVVVVAEPMAAQKQAESLSMAQGLERGVFVFYLSRSTTLVTLDFATPSVARGFETQATNMADLLGRDPERLPPERRALVMPWLDAFKRRKSTSREGTITFALELDPGVIERTMLAVIAGTMSAGVEPAAAATGKPGTPAGRR